MKKRILCYGDSITWGYIPATGKRYDENTRWTGILQNRLGGGYTVLEDGLNGRTTIYDATLKRYRNGMESLGYSLMSQHPLDLMILALGINDISYIDPEDAGRGIRAILRHLVCANHNYTSGDEEPIFRGKTRILLIAPSALNPAYADLRENGRMKYETSKAFSAAFQKAAEDFGVYYLDASKIAMAPPTDGIHLDEAGHAAMAEAIAAKVLEIFAEDEAK